MRTTKLSNWILSVQVWPWLATLLALAIRSIALGRADLWQDEMLLVQTANPAQTLAQVLANSINIAVSMAWLPLPAAIQYIFLKILGALDSTLVVSPLINRLPGVVLGSLAIPALAQMGFAAGGRRLMLTTSIWAMLTFYFVFYSREVHAYPLLMCLAAWHWRMLLHIWNHNKGGTWFWLAWFCLEIALALTHLTAALMMGATAFVTLIAFLMAWKRREPEHLKCLFLTLLGIGVGLLAVLPYYVAILTKQNPHLMMHSSMSISLMLQDMIARMTFGEHVIGVIGGWAICGTGIGWLIMAGHTRTGLIRVLGAFALAFLIIAFAAYRTQYLSARYFMTLAPVMGLISGAAFLFVADFAVGKIARGKIIRAASATALLTVAIGVHAGLFLPPYFALKTKSVDFKVIADWLRKTQSPGTPFLMESAYELRYVGGFYPVPGLIPAAPYVHGSGKEELQRLHARQMDFMQRFPEAPFIESAHHNWNEPGGVWDWPHRNFRSRVCLANTDLRQLIKMGIYPGTPREIINGFSYVTDIYFNTPEDLVKQALNRGESVLFRFPGWEIQQQRISNMETLYYRVRQGNRASIDLINIGEKSIRGTIRIDLAPLATIGNVVPISVTLNGQALATASLPSGQQSSWESPIAELKAGTNVLHFQSQLPGYNGLAVLNNAWQTTE